MDNQNKPIKFITKYITINQQDDSKMTTYNTLTLEKKDINKTIVSINEDLTQFKTM